MRSFLRAVRAFLSRPVDGFAFQAVSLGQQVSIIFTSNGPLIYRWELNNRGNGRSAAIGGQKKNRKARSKS
jgi:hypothetical protein